MTSPDTRSLRQLLKDILETSTEVARLSGDSAVPSLRAPASPETIASLEAALGLPLPPSYREFLEITDGVEHFNAGFELLGALQMLGPGYEAEVKRLRQQAWDAGQRGPIEGIIIGLLPGSHSFVFLDRSRPSGNGEFHVVYWAFEALGNAPTFREFLVFWSTVIREVLANIQASIANDKEAGPHAP